MLVLAAPAAAGRMVVPVAASTAAAACRRSRLRRPGVGAAAAAGGGAAAVSSSGRLGGAAAAPAGPDGCFLSGHLFSPSHNVNLQRLDGVILAGAGKRNDRMATEELEDDEASSLLTSDDETTMEAVAVQSPRSKLIAAAVVLASLATLAVVYISTNGLPDPSDVLKSIQHVVDDAGPLGYVYFAAAYIALSLLFLPASPLTIGAGFIFGPAVGTAVVSASSTTAATLAFIISRYVARPQLSQLIEGNRRFGLTKVGLVQYVAASWVGMLPATFAYVYLGGAGRSIGGIGDKSLVQTVLTVVGLGATFVVVGQVSRQATRLLKDADEAEES
eukprot:jgi/Chlat1/4977/Chrsp32S04958